MWPRFSLSAPSGVVAGPYQHLWPLGAPIGAVSGGKSQKGGKNGHFLTFARSGNNIWLSTCPGAMHIVSLGALGTPRAIAVAWWVNGGQL